MDVLEEHVADDDAVGGTSGRAAVEVVLLHVDTIDVDVADGDVAVHNVVDVAGGVGVGLDAEAVLRVEDDRVGEGDVGHIVVALSAHRSDAQTVAAVAVHVIHPYVVPARHSNTVVLVDNHAVAYGEVGRGADVETI